MALHRHFVTLAVALAVLGCNPPSDEARDGAQSAASSAGSQARERRAVVVAAHPLASEAGAEMLRRGGSAVDAAIAAQAVLTLVEPQSSGLGGGAFMLHHDGRDGVLTAYDGRETAPAGATPDLFLREDGEEMDLLDAVVGGHSVGVPGVVAMLGEAHARHGKLPWATLFEPAIRLSEEGFPVSERLAAMIRGLTGRGRLDGVPATAAYFYDEDGSPLKEGTVLRNPELAQSLRLIAEGGPRAFYEGPIAEAIVTAVTQTTFFPSAMTLEDLATYEPRVLEAVCAPFAGARVCTMPPPSSGVILLELLGVLDRTNVSAEGAWTEVSARLFAEASRLAYADQDRHMADGVQVAVPVAGLVNPAYHDARAALIDGDGVMDVVPAGEPDAFGDFAPDRGPKAPSTSHMTITDPQGNVLTMTTTVEFPFGSHLMAGGFILNNQLTDFAFTPEVGGLPVANAVAPGKRPRSSMTPAIVYDDDGAVIAALGSPGGTGIIAYVAKTILAHVGWGLDIDAAVETPNLVARRGRIWLERGRFETTLQEALREDGYGARLGERGLTSGVNAISLKGGEVVGAADPRREGAPVYVDAIDQ